MPIWSQGDQMKVLSDRRKLVPPLSERGADSEATTWYRCATNAGQILRPESGPDFGPAKCPPKYNPFMGPSFAGPKSCPDSGLRICPAFVARRYQFVVSESAPRSDSGVTNFPRSPKAATRCQDCGVARIFRSACFTLIVVRRSRVRWRGLLGSFGQPQAALSTLA